MSAERGVGSRRAEMTLSGWLVRNSAPLGIAAATYALAVALPAGDPDAYWHIAS